MQLFLILLIVELKLLTCMQGFVLDADLIKDELDHAGCRMILLLGLFLCTSVFNDLMESLDMIRGYPFACIQVQLAPIGMVVLFIYGMVNL
jgi:hypothetical protein